LSTVVAVINNENLERCIKFFITLFWQHNAEAPAGAPNLVMILLDDVGFG
jgi:hypothetical protein